MKRVIYGSTKAGSDSRVTFTPVEIVDLLRNIVELEGQNVSYEIRKDGTVEFVVNDIAYNLA